MKRYVSMIILASIILFMSPLNTNVLIAGGSIYNYMESNQTTKSGLTAGVSAELSDALISDNISTVDNNLTAGISNTIMNCLASANESEVTINKKEVTVVAQPPEIVQIEPEPKLTEYEIAQINNENIYEGEGYYIVLGRSITSLSESEFDLFCRIIMAEAEGEPDETQIAVAETVLNRVDSKTFPDTVTDVIWQRDHGVQFSPTIDGRINLHPSERVIKNAKIALIERRYPKEMLFFTSTNYTRGYTEYDKIGNMYFSLYYGD